jgi:hypothetical protein
VTAVAPPVALLVGELNPYQLEEKARYALFPWPEASAGGRLCRVVLGLEPRRYIAAYARANLCSGRWSAPAARERARDLALRYFDRPIVLLGSRVADAFGLPFEPFTHREGFVLLPHPSGRCRAWQRPDAVDRARAVMRAAGALPVAEAPRS